MQKPYLWANRIGEIFLGLGVSGGNVPPGYYGMFLDLGRRGSCLRAYANTGAFISSPLEGVMILDLGISKK